MQLANSCNQDSSVLSYSDVNRPFYNTSLHQAFFSTQTYMTSLMTQLMTGCPALREAQDGPEASRHLLFPALHKAATHLRSMLATFYVNVRDNSGQETPR